MMFTIALKLGKTIAEIEGVAFEEFWEWVAFFNIEAEDNAKDAEQ